MFYTPKERIDIVYLEKINGPEDIKELNVNKNYSTHDISGKKYLDFKNIINEGSRIIW